MAPLMDYMGSEVIVLGNPDLSYDPRLMANAVCRIIFGTIFVIASWIPLRLLWRNGEFAASIFVINNDLLALFFIVNAMIWHNNDMEHWWLGGGWCDIQQYCVWQMTTLYASSVCAIMRQLAKRVGVARMAEYTATQKRNQVLIQAAIIFPVPLLQVLIASMVQTKRYSITAVRGCGNFYAPDVIFLVFLVLPAPVFTVTAVVFACITYFRYKKVEQSIRFAHNSNSASSAASRSRRTKRKLYTMTCSILLVYTPFQIFFLGSNIRQGWPWSLPGAFRQHYVDKIFLIPYGLSGWIEMNMAYVSIVTIAVVFLFFGTGKEALNIYRRIFLAMGLSRLFPSLEHEWDPDRTQRGTFAQISSTQKTTSTGTTTKSSMTNLKGTTQHISLTDNPAIQHQPARTAPSNPYRTGTTPGYNQHSAPHQPFETDVRDFEPPNPHTALSMLAMPRPSLRWWAPAKLPSLFSSRGKDAAPASTIPLDSVHTAPSTSDGHQEWSHSATAPLVRTRVWAAEDAERVTRPNTSRDSGAGPSVRVETRVTRSTEDADDDEL